MRTDFCFRRGRCDCHERCYAARFGSDVPPPTTKIHELSITMRKNGNGRLLNVRCWCMAELSGPPRRFHGYDVLGVVSSLEEAQALYRKHLTETT